MRIVITGPTGAVGMALIQECIENNVEVLAVCHKGSRRKGKIPKSSLIEILELDLDEYARYVPGKYQNNYDIFYHLAWNGTIGDERNDMKLQHDNVGYSLDAVLLAEKLGCHTFIGAGSQAEYGRVNGVISSSSATFPENGYGIAKLCAGKMTRILCEQHGIKHIWMRILSIYGPYDGEKTMVITTIRKLLKREIPQFTKGEQMWDYLYSKDAAKAMLALGEKGVNGKVYCIGGGQARPLSEYIMEIKNSIDPNLKLDMGAIPYSPKQVMYLCADISDLTNDTGFMPVTDFSVGIKETIEWVKNNG